MGPNNIKGINFCDESISSLSALSSEIVLFVSARLAQLNDQSYPIRAKNSTC